MIPLALCQTQPQLTADHQAAAERFSRTLVAMHRSPHTVRLYVGSLKHWFAAGGATGHVDAELLAAWLGRRRRLCAAATVNLDIKALRAFYRLQTAHGEASDAEVAKIPRQRKVPKRLPRWLSDAEVGQVLGTCPLDTFIGLRDYAMLLTLYTCGLRAGELIGMQTSDLVERDLLFVCGKGGHHRYVPVGEQLAGVLEGYLHARGAIRPGKKHTFWLRADGRPLRNARSVWEIASRRIWKALGVEGGLSKVSRGGRPWSGHYPHELRASFATALLHRGMPITAIAQIMGHASVETTAHYLGVDLEHLRVAAKFHPRAFRQKQ